MTHKYLHQFKIKPSFCTFKIYNLIEVLHWCYSVLIEYHKNLLYVNLGLKCILWFKMGFDPRLSLQQHKMATYSFGINTTSLVNISEEEEDIRSLAKQFLMYKVGKHNISISYFINKFDDEK